jgi:hypothetical protein
MRWSAAILAVIVAAMLAGCGGGSGSTIEERNAGDPPQSQNATQGLIERQIKRRYTNLSYVHCEPEAGRTARFGNDYWECAIRLKKYGDAGAKLDLVVSGSHVKFGRTECYSDAGESGPDICRHIHQRGSVARRTHG